MPRPASTYRGAIRNAGRSKRAAMLKATAARRGMTRRELDRERNAVRCFIWESRVCKGFTEGQLLELTRQVANAL